MALRVGCEYPADCGYIPETAGCTFFDCLLNKKTTTSIPAEFLVSDSPVADGQPPAPTSPMAPENMVAGVNREIKDLKPL